MTNYQAFYLIDAGTERIHLVGFDPVAGEWLVPCASIPPPTEDAITYSPTKPLCVTCANLTHGPSPSPSRFRRTRSR